MLGSNTVITGSTHIIDVTGPEPVTYKGYVPPRSVVVPGSYRKQFPAGEYSITCALIIGQRKESTDKNLAERRPARFRRIGITPVCEPPPHEKDTAPADCRDTAVRMPPDRLPLYPYGTYRGAERLGRTGRIRHERHARRASRPDGSFRYKGRYDEPTAAALVRKNGQTAAVLYIEPGNIRIEDA